VFALKSAGYLKACIGDLDNNAIYYGLNVVVELINLSIVKKID